MYRTFPIAMFDYRRVTVTRHRSSTNPHNYHCENLDVQKSLKKCWPVKLSSPSMDHLIIFRMRECKCRFYWKLPFLFLRCFLFCTVIFVWKSDLPKIPWSIIILLLIMTILGGIPHEIPMISPCLLVLPFPMAFQPEASPNPCLITSAKRFTVGPPSRAKSARERRTAKRFLQPRRLGIEKNGGSNARKASKSMLRFLLINGSFSRNKSPGIFGTSSTCPWCGLATSLS